MALSDDQFLDAFLAARLEPSQFDHRGHLRAAWLLLRRAPVDDAVATTCRGIQALAQRFGVPEKFHRTRTEALVRLMAPAAARIRDFDGFLAAEPALLNDARGLLARHYSADRLEGAEARAGFVPPDRRPLPA